MLRYSVTFEVAIQDQDEVLSALRTAEQATGLRLVDDLLDALHAQVRDGDVRGTIYLTSNDSGALYWTTDPEEATQDDEPMSVHWEWVDTTASQVEVL
jgi:hypothetical protein